MLDIKLIRQNPELVKDALKKRGASVDIDKLLELDRKRIEISQQIEQIRFQKNQANRKIKEAKNEEEKSRIIMGMKEIDKKEDELNEGFKKTEKELNSLMFQLPNIPFDDTPIGSDETGNIVVKKEGKIPKLSFKPRDYMEIGEALDIIDVKRASKVSGSRFGYLKKEAALLEMALVNFVFNELAKENFIPIIPPVLIKPEMMWGMGYIDTETDKAERYFFEKDNLFLVGTAEQSIGPLHQGEIFQEKDLPKRYVAFSTCFREEAGSYGKDTKGILRVHQFDKIEMFSYCLPEESKKELRFLVNQQEKLMKLLKIPYQLVRLCSGDLARPSAATFDIESWLPGQERYRETHSASCCNDFQARRLNIRYKNKEGKLDFVHTLNGTVFAVGRTIIAIIENYQQKNGTVKMPAALQKYLKFKLMKAKDEKRKNRN